jgi:hypothetical protein
MNRKFWSTNLIIILALLLIGAVVAMAQGPDTQHDPTRFFPRA